MAAKRPKSVHLCGLSAGGRGANGWSAESDIHLEILNALRCRLFRISCVFTVYRDTKETEGRMNVEDKRRRDERFVEAIRQNRAGMFRVARMMLRSDSDAEEAVADATESAYAHLRTLRNWEAVRPWLMRITVNACHKMLRRRKRETPSGDETLFDRPIKTSDATEIWSLVEQLDALYSVPLTMFYADGMKLEEIAAALHVPKGTVSARMTRGRQKLKTWMEEEL